MGEVSKLVEYRARSWRRQSKPLRSGIFGRRKCMAPTQIPLRPVAHKAHALGREIPALPDCSPPLSRKNTTGAARSREQLLDRWPKVLLSLNGSISQKKPTNDIMAKTICFMTCANHGIGAEIARAALAVGTSLPTQTSAASWPSPKGESHSWLADLVTAPSMQDVEPRCLPSV